MSLNAEQVINRIGAEPPEEEEEDIGELGIAEYIVFLLALETYSRYLEEVTGQQDAEDDLTRRAMQLIRRADRKHADIIKTFLGGHLSKPVHKTMLDKAFRVLPTKSGIDKRTFLLDRIFSKSGPSVMRAVFKTNKALQEVRQAMAASAMEDADAALDKFAAISMKNPFLRNWIDKAAKAAGAGTYQNAVAASAGEVVDHTKDILTTRAQQQGTQLTSEENRDAVVKKDDQIFEVQQKATEAAQKAMSVSGEPDEPPAKSEVIGIATAVAMAAATDPSNSSNIPVPLRKLDDEQRAAALTDGRVLVAAGAGAGKSTTVVSRVEYLVKDRRVLPSRILVTSFNNKAAKELEQKIGTVVGGDAVEQMSVGTMHSLFRKFIGEYGTEQERNALGLGKTRGGFVKGGDAVARAVQRIWAECFSAGSKKERKVPKLKTVLMAKTKWAGNNITPAEAKKNFPLQEDEAEWYEMYEGLMGTIPNWKPPCTNSKSYESFMARWRPNNQRLGDFDAMLSIFDNILKREPLVKKTLQGMFDNIIVDEAQDLNGVQNSIITQLSEHISDGKDGKSLWIVGDDKQSINLFRGARPDLFTQLSQTEGWKVKFIRTNYRCQPELVEFANRLIAHNEKQIKMEAVPSDAKVRGVGSIKVKKSLDEAAAALDVVEEIKANIASGEDVASHAILTRTNKEQHAFETACIIRGIPYARKGASSFLGSPETKAVLGYVQLVTGDDFGKMQEALGDIINKPNRFFITPDAGTTAVSEALKDFARYKRMETKSINPIEALSNPSFRETLAEKLSKSRSGFKFNKAVEKLTEIYLELVDLKRNTEDPEFTTKDLFDGILGMTGSATVVDSQGQIKYVTQTFRESLKVDMRDAISDEDDVDEEDEEDETEGLGNVSFLYKLMEKDPTDPDDTIIDPNTPFGFKSKIDRYAKRVDDLRFDLKAWDKKQRALPPEQRKAPPGVFLGTCHSTKGAQWTNVYVSMPKGKFPLEPPTKPGEPPPDLEILKEEREAERRLAYVALTRAAMNLTVVCPDVVGGKAGGVSPFVAEAGLQIGENVPKITVKTAHDWSA